MEAKIKKWEEYTKEEQTGYLIHWFCYYGNMIFNLQELEDFKKLAETRQDDIFNHIVTIFICKDTIQSGMLFSYMKEDKIDELFAVSLTKEKIPETEKDDLSAYEDIRNIITTELTKFDQKDDEKSTTISQS